MEDGVKEEPAQCKEPKFLGKAGWVKKATGKLLASYKDRYVQVEKTEIVLYEDEELQNCSERLDLENYDRCIELKSTFKKKNRLVLIRASKPGNKAHDLKFQVQTPEEKDAWIKALSDGISRAKNKVFDEVKVDESSNLDHVTRSRPKGNRNRRPPTRIHMKEVAVLSSDGMLRLDLDLADATMPNGAHDTNVDVRENYSETTKVTVTPHSGSKSEKEYLEEEPQTEPGVSLQKKVIKPPMPPTKESKPLSAPDDQPDKSDDPEKKVLNLPLPPTKEAKPCTWIVEESTEETKSEVLSEKSPDPRKKGGPPPAPPNKPISSSMNNLTEALSSNPVSQLPTPPSKDKKPLQHSAVLNQENQPCKLDRMINQHENEDTKIKDTEESYLITEEALFQVKDDSVITESASAKGHSGNSEEDSELVLSSRSNTSSKHELQLPVPVTVVLPESHKKGSSPLLSPKKKPVKPVHLNMVTPSELSEPQTQPAADSTDIISQPDDRKISDTSIGGPQDERALQLFPEVESEVPALVVCLSEPVASSLSPLICHLPSVTKKKAEEKSVDSGQHSDDSETSENEDTLAASTAALRGSHAGLDVLDNSEDDFQISDSPRMKQATADVRVRAMQQPCHGSQLTTSSKPFKTPRSASIGDLLAHSSGSLQVKQHARTGAKNARATTSTDNVSNLENEVALEMAKTSQLLSRLSQSHGRGDTGESPETLLAKAMEKLKKADHFLREIKKLKDSNLIQNEKKRMSW
ncbi:flocculation protein FLO11 [Thalassophryne amazonica]|uniref:flocculation protein FLO11 n=1 Tax=Thalassophryne amazonica TaxID=390379 RepID=UPI0014712291|nr:flocculation protein FLO11 [Thalassophryne amazonica]